MTNSERIQANNAELQECIDKANALPDAAVSLLARVLVEDGEILFVGGHTNDPDE